MSTVSVYYCYFLRVFDLTRECFTSNNFFVVVYIPNKIIFVILSLDFFD